MSSESLATLVKDWRTAAGLSGKDVAARLRARGVQIADRSYYEIEQGKRPRPSQKFIEEFSALSLIPVSDLMRGMQYPVETKYSSPLTPRAVELFEQASPQLQESILASLRATVELERRRAAESSNLPEGDRRQ